MSEPTRRLRVLHLVVQPVLVWLDEDDELAPGPELSATTIPLKQVSDFVARFPAELAALQAQLEDHSEDPAEGP